MRSDYTLYVIAIICFLLAAIVLVEYTQYLEAVVGTALTVILVILGLIFAGVGYSQRPKGILPPPASPALGAPLKESAKPEKKAVRKRKKRSN